MISWREPGTENCQFCLGNSSPLIFPHLLRPSGLTTLTSPSWLSYLFYIYYTCEYVDRKLETGISKKIEKTERTCHPGKLAVVLLYIFPMNFEGALGIYSYFYTSTEQKWHYGIFILPFQSLVSYVSNRELATKCRAGKNCKAQTRATSFESSDFSWLSNIFLLSSEFLISSCKVAFKLTLTQENILIKSDKKSWKCCHIGIYIAQVCTLKIIF